MTPPVPLALPANLALFAALAGREAALKIAQAAGGRRLYIPHKAEGSQLARIVGLDAALIISEALGGDNIEIPQARRAVNSWLRDQGRSQEARAGALKTARKTIQIWDAQDRARSAQPDLFEKS